LLKHNTYNVIFGIIWYKYNNVYVKTMMST